MKIYIENYKNFKKKKKYYLSLVTIFVAEKCYNKSNKSGREKNET